LTFFGESERNKDSRDIAPIKKAKNKT
jgi:hypothetical protein